MKLAIFGAQGIALGAYHAIKKLFPEEQPLCFLVTERGINPETLLGVPVKMLAEFAAGYIQEEKDQIRIFIATPENVMPEIEERLESCGFYNHIRLTSARWAQMQRNAFIGSERFIPLEKYPAGIHIPRIHVYKAVFPKDRPLQTAYTDAAYITPLQVGAAGTDVRIAEVTDNTGDHISDRNGNYSELTGLYWIWKNRVESGYYGEGCYYGLAHYRRLLELSADDLLRLVDNDIDVVLPYPMPYVPDIEEHHKRYLTDSEWKAVLQALQELAPEYVRAFDGILKQEYFYNYNIIIAKDSILDEYCSWLFPILFRTEEICNPKGGKAPNRFIGYVGETLETLYFIYHQEKLKIAHTGCRFLI